MSAISDSDKSDTPLNDDSSKKYLTTFTPKDEDELDKVCPQCHKFLAAKAFNSRNGTRNGIKGKIRNSACLKCEGKTSRIRASRVSSIIQDEIRILTHEKEILKSDLQTEKDSNSKLQTLLIDMLKQNVDRDLRIKNLEDFVSKIENSKKSK